MQDGVDLEARRVLKSPLIGCSLLLWYQTSDAAGSGVAVMESQRVIDGCV